jgi:hypothetical protein
MTLGGFRCVAFARISRASGKSRNQWFSLHEETHNPGGMFAVGRLDLSVARSLSHIRLMLKHAPHHLQYTRVVLCAHCRLLFFVWIFSSRTEGPSPSQKVSKRICRLCFGLHVANSRSYGTGVLSGNAVKRTRTHSHMHAHTCTPLRPPQTPPRACRCSHFSGVL